MCRVDVCGPRHTAEHDVVMAAFRDYVDAPINIMLPSVADKTKYQPNEATFSERLRKRRRPAAIVFHQTTHAASPTGLTALQFLYPHHSTPWYRSHNEDKAAPLAEWLTLPAPFLPHPTARFYEWAAGHVLSIVRRINSVNYTPFASSLSWYPTCFDCQPSPPPPQPPTPHQQPFHDSPP